MLPVKCRLWQWIWQQVISESGRPAPICGLPDWRHYRYPAVGIADTRAAGSARRLRTRAINGGGQPFPRGYDGLPGMRLAYSRCVAPPRTAPRPAWPGDWAFGAGLQPVTLLHSSQEWMANAIVRSPARGRSRAS